LGTGKKRKRELELHRIWRRGEEKYGRRVTGGSDGQNATNYTKEFKQQAVNLFKTSGKSKTHIARDLVISDSTFP
jgi:transposase-like protein